MLEIIIGVIVVISFLLLIATVINNRFQLAIIKIEKAEEDIDIYLEKRVFRSYKTYYFKGIKNRRFYART